MVASLDAFLSILVIYDDSLKSGYLRLDLCVLNASVNPADLSHSLKSDKWENMRLGTFIPLNEWDILNPISFHSFSHTNPDRNESS